MVDTSCAASVNYMSGVVIDPQMPQMSQIAQPILVFICAICDIC